MRAIGRKVAVTVLAGCMAALCAMALPLTLKLRA